MIISDLHIHSRHSRACSKQIDIENLEKWARVKGVNLLGTGDFTHPEWIKELKSKLEGDGIYKTKTGFDFILQTEVSLMYTQHGRGRRVHLIIFAPNFEVVDQITEYLKSKGRIDYDGRPIFKIPCDEFVEEMMKISQDIEVIPAHIWTSWFGVLGSKGGYDSIKEAFGDQVKHIHALETGLSCYDKKTEVLTENGWKKISKVKYNNKICTLDIETDKVEFQKPTKIFCYKYKGKMYKLKTKRVDLFVTPNHKLLVSHCDFRKPTKFLLKETESMFNKSKRFKKNGLWVGKNPKYFVLPAVKMKHGSRYYSGFRNKKEKKFPMKSWLKFFGFWIAEGWTTQGKNGHYCVCLANNNKSLLKQMEQMLNSFGYSVYCDYKVSNTLRIRDYQLFNYLKQFGKSGSKYVPEDIKSLSKDLLNIFFKYYIKGDGHVYGRNRKGLSATTSSIKLRDDLQEIALKVGMSAYYKLHKLKSSPFKSPSNGKIYYQNEDTWVIYFIRQNIHTVLPSIIKKYNYTEKWVNFNDKVFCVSVPNKIIYVRRNGIPVWCGNSDPEMNWRLSQLDKYTLVSFSDLHSFWPWRLGRECTVFDIELSYKNLIKALRTKEGFKETIEVDPAYGKYHWDGHRNCGVCFEPKETRKLGGICPKCGRSLTIGVEYRVEELADRKLGEKPEGAIGFKRLIPLSEILSKVYGKAIATKTIWNVYNKIVSSCSEYEILLNKSFEELKQIAGENVASLIVKNREGKLKVQPGYDGAYGELILEGSVKKEQAEGGQANLSNF